MDKDTLVSFLITMIFVLIFSFFIFYSWNSDKQKYQLIPLENGKVAILLNTVDGKIQLIRPKKSKLELETLDIYENPYINENLKKEYLDLEEKVFDEISKETKNAINKDDDDDERPYDIQEELNQSIPSRFRH